MKMTKVLGISGYMGSGKTFAGRFFERKGFYFVDADAVVDDLYEVGAEGWRKIKDYFGEGYLMKDGNVNRKKLARLVFGDVRKLGMINNLIHPLVNSEISKRVDGCNLRYAVVEASYFREKQLLDLVDAILWIECDDDVLLKRAIKSGMDGEMFDAVKGMQEKPAKIDFMIENNGNKAEFNRKLETVYGKFI